MWEIVQKGGPLMYLIGLCSVISLALVIERLYHLYQARIDTKNFMKSITDTVKRNRVGDAIELCESTPGPIAQIVKAGILKQDRPRREIKEAIEDVAVHEVPPLEKNLSALATIAHITPLLGLLGTVTGMVRSFQIIEQQAANMNPINPGDLAGGIWEALITTVAGLSVAIPTYVAYNYLVSRVDALVLDMEKSATSIVNILDAKREE